MPSGGIDYAALWRQVEAETARAVVIDLPKKTIVAGRAMGDTSSGFASGSTLERLFPGAPQLVERWGAHPEDEAGGMATHGLSPRQWAYFWRLDGRTGVLAIVHHRYGRGAISAGDAAVIRLLCEHWLAPELQALGVGPAAAAPWNRVERRGRGAAPRELWGALAALSAAVACGVWLLLGAAGSLVESESSYARENQRLAKLSDQTLVRSLANAMAGKDYGEVQDALAEHLTFGHYDAAAVLNERKQVVAHVGFSRPPAVGQALPAELEGSARRLALTWAGNGQGELVAVQKPAPIGKELSRLTVAGLRLAGALLVIVGLICGALLWRHVRARYR